MADRFGNNSKAEQGNNPPNALPMTRKPDKGYKPGVDIYNKVTGNSERSDGAPAKLDKGE